MADLDFVTIAQQFVTFYYQAFDRNRTELAPLYRDNSMLTFETNQVQGAQAIVEKLVSLPFKKIIHQTATVDAQPAGPDGSIIVMVTGGLLTDEDGHPQTYAQTFHLKPEAGSYYVLNDVFRIVLLTG